MSRKPIGWAPNFQRYVTTSSIASRVVQNFLTDPDSVFVGVAIDPQTQCYAIVRRFAEDHYGALVLLDYVRADYVFNNAEPKLLDTLYLSAK